MTLLKHEIQEHLTEPNPDQGRANRATHPGQAHFADPSKRGLTCRQCAHWQHRSHEYYRSKFGGLIKPAQCAMFKKLNHGKAGKPVPDTAPACRHFEFNPDPPERFAR